MDDIANNRVGEAPQAFQSVAELAPLAARGVHRVKVFKSGNSLALRLPKALGLEAGMEMELTTLPGGGYGLNLAQPLKRKLDISGFWGKAKRLHVPERRDFDERPSAIAARLAKGGA